MLLLAGCAAHAEKPSLPPVSAKEWIGVLKDWNEDARIERRHSCGAVVVAVAEIATLARRQYATQTASYRAAIDSLDKYAGTVCTHHGRLDKLRVGMTDATVAAVAGMPRT